MNPAHYLACDLGMDRGRIMLGTLARGQLTVCEIAQFPIHTRDVKGLTCWDLTRLERDIFAGIEVAAARGLPISGLSANSWDGDFVLLDASDRPLQMPSCGVNGHGDAAAARLLEKLPLSTIYAETGTALLPLHTLFQIEAGHEADPALFGRAQRFLPIADYLNARFSGVAACEESLASTTQLYNPQTHAWSPKLFAALDLPGRLLPRLVPSGTAFGPVVDELRRHPAMVNARVVATCSQARAAALAAVPARAEQPWAFLHIDGRSHFGVELTSPILTSQACEDGFTNEVGLGGSIHFLKAGPGCQMLRDCQATWAAQGERFSDEHLLRLASESPASRAHIQPALPRFQDAPNLPAEITAYCRQTGQPVPATAGETVRLILESLALEFSETLLRLEALTAREIDLLHIVGPASENALLNQMIADATGLAVIAGPADAAAIGNLLIQALALWHVKSPDHLRSVVASSFPAQIHKPGSGFSQQAHDRFHALRARAPTAQAA